jgi:uncharacterized 2Fe-2S/4Fe-4S cluster protein (DUF4445 family)
MKKLAIVMAAMMLMGCAGVSVATNDSAKVAGKIAGVYVASKYPAATSTILPYAKGLLQVAQEGNLTSDQVTAAVMALYGQLGDDAELKTLIVAATSAITVELQTGAINSQAVSALEGFIAGLQLSS